MRDAEGEARVHVARLARSPRSDSVATLDCARVCMNSLLLVAKTSLARNIPTPLLPSSLDRKVTIISPPRRPRSIDTYSASQSHHKTEQRFAGS